MFFIRKYSSVPFGTAIVVINNELLSSVTIAFFFSEEYQSHLKKITLLCVQKCQHQESTLNIGSAYYN